MAIALLCASWYVGLGGGEIDLLALAQGLHATGRYQPHLLTPYEGQLPQRWRQAGWQSHITHYRGASTFFVPGIWARFPVVRRLETLLKHHNIRLIHSDYHTLPLIAPAARRLGIPLIWTCHGWWFHPRPWQRTFFRRIPAIVARSQAIRAGFLGQPPFMPAEAMPVIYSGIDTNQFHPQVSGQIIRARIGLDATTPLVALIARFQDVKGHDIFLEMARQVARQVPTAHFVVAGDSIHNVGAEATYKARILAEHATDPILRERVHYIGFYDAVEEVIGAADVVVCSSHFESYGRVNLEAMACARPVVSTNQGGPAETVVNGETGYLVPPRDPAALAGPVIRLLEDETLRHSMGQAGYDRIVAHFSASATTQAYDEIYQRLLTKSSAFS